MIRRLIILLLIAGCVFGDTIVYKRLLLGEWEDETLKKVSVDKIEDGAVWYTQKQFFSTTTETISCNRIIQILNSNGKELYLDCRMPPLNPQEENKKTTATTINKIDTITPSSSESLSNIDQARLGAICIAIGGGFLLTTTETDCKNCSLEELKDKTGRIKSSAQIGYGLIFGGGILLALGI